MPASRTFAPRQPVAVARVRRVRRVPGESPGLTQRRVGGGNQPAQRALGSRAALSRLAVEPLHSPLRRELEGFYRRDLASVRVHAAADAHAAARGLRARAFTLGQDIVFGAGRYAPHTDGGRRLIAHEIAHAIEHARRGDDHSVHRAIDDTAAPFATGNASPEAALDDATPCAEGATDHPLISIGSVGPPVAEAQCKLNGASVRMQDSGEPPLAETPLDVDAMFGPLTRNAVRAFQQRVFPMTPVEWDGVVGPKTWAALDETLSQSSGVPALCPAGTELDPYSETTFADGVPGFEPCQSAGKVARPPPELKFLSAVPDQKKLKAEASNAITPHLHLGTKVPTGTAGAAGECPARDHAGVQFGARADGVAGTGGELFYSQVIRASKRTTRIGTDTLVETIKDKLDGGKVYRGTAVPASDLPNSICEADSPGQGDRRAKEVGERKTRVSFHLHDEFELFLMWRPAADADEAKWLSYDSVKWSWDAVATGITNDSKLPWLGPDEAFAVCGKPDLQKGTAKAGAKPKAPTHLGLPENTLGPPGSLTTTLKDRVAKDSSTEPNC